MNNAESTKRSGRWARIAATSAFALSLAIAGPAFSQGQGNGNGNGKGNNKNASAPANPGGGGAKKNGNGNGNAPVNRGQAKKNDNGPAMQRGNGNVARADNAPTMRGNGNDRVRPNAPARNVVSDVQRRVERRVVDRGSDNVRVIRDTARRVNDWRPTRTVTYLDGCPPGLAKKNNGCTPPGLDRRDNRSRYYDEPRWWGYDRSGSDRYYYDDGYLLRLNGSNVAGFIPLLGGALSIGNVWPSSYQPVRMPDYYVDYYDLGAQPRYRYYDDVIYRVDPETQAIRSIAALLTGDNFTVGQPLPSGYDVYNVPYSYRDRYYDTPQAHYRYSDGYVYEVDPETTLIASAIKLLT
jgi:hypothetical protein